MKRGIKFQSLPNPPLPHVASYIAPKVIEGIAVRFEANHPGVADARGIAFWKHIVIGPALLKLEPRMQHAILLHEALHCKSFHLEQRLLLLVMMMVPLVSVLPWSIIGALAATLVIYGCSMVVAREQEKHADAYAVQQGYGKEMARFLRSMQPEMPRVFYPDFATRMGAIETAMKEHDHDQKG